MLIVQKSLLTNPEILPGMWWKTYYDSSDILRSLAIRQPSTVSNWHWKVSRYYLLQSRLYKYSCGVGNRADFGTGHYRVNTFDSSYISFAWLQLLVRYYLAAAKLIIMYAHDNSHCRHLITLYPTRKQIMNAVTSWHTVPLHIWQRNWGYYDCCCCCCFRFCCIYYGTLKPVQIGEQWNGKDLEGRCSMQSRGKNSSWTAGHPKMGAIGCTATLETKYQFTQRKKFHRGRNQKSISIFLSSNTRHIYVMKILNFVIFIIPENNILQLFLLLWLSVVRRFFWMCFLQASVIMHMKQVWKAVHTNTFR
jgi:hypothetical protein